MKTEDIDKRIGMPDVDKEWARFEREVISGGTKRRSALTWAVGIGIAASVALLLIFNIGKKQEEQAPLIVQTEEIKPQPVREVVQTKEQELVAKASTPLIAQNKKPASTNANALATSSLDISAHEYTGAVQKPMMNDIEDLAFESVDQALQNIASADLSSGTTLRLRGTGDYRPSDKDRMDSTLILVNGEPLPEHLRREVLGNDPDDIDTYVPRYFYQQHQLLDEVYVHKDSEFTEKFGERAKYGVIEIKTVPDTYCDAYVRKHPKLMKKYTRVEGYIVDSDGKPLTEAWIHIKKKSLTGAATDSTGHYVFWVPKKDVTLCAEQTGYRTVEFSPADNTLVMHLEPGTSMRLRGNSEPDPELRGVIAGLPDAPPNDSILYIVNGVPQPKENNKWLSKRSFLDYFHGQHLLVDSVKRNMNEEAKQRYIERFGMAAKHGVVEYFCVEDTLCDYYMNQHKELKASRRRVSGVVLDENDEPLDHTLIHILQFQPEKKIWGVETTDSLGNFAFWVPRTDIELHFKYIGYKAVVVEPTDTFLTVRLVPNSVMQSMK